MSVNSEIQRISSAVADAYDAVDDMGGTLPSSQVVANLANAIKTIPQGGGSAISVTEEEDVHGGTIKHITAVDISADTVTADHLETGYTAHDRFGNPVVGRMSPGGGTIWQDQNGFVHLGSEASGGGGGATQHTIHLEFMDGTDTDIDVYYDDTLIQTMITAYTPTIYGGKTVALAELDDVVWYQPASIPLNTELIDYTKVSSNMAINQNAEAFSQQWYYASDYTPVSQGMTFTYTAGYWYYIGLYDSSKDPLSAIYVYTDGTVDQNDGNTGHGTLSGNKLPSGVAYVRLCGTAANSTHMSLIRTA